MNKEKEEDKHFRESLKAFEARREFEEAYRGMRERMISGAMTGKDLKLFWKLFPKWALVFAGLMAGILIGTCTGIIPT